MGDLTALTGKSGMTKDEQELYKSFLDAIDRIANILLCPIYSSKDIRFNEWFLQVNCNEIGFVFHNSQDDHIIRYAHKNHLWFYVGYDDYQNLDHKYLIYRHVEREAYENNNKWIFIRMLSEDPSFIYEILRINEDLRLMIQNLYDSVNEELESFINHAHALQKWIMKVDKL